MGFLQASGYIEYRGDEEPYTGRQLVPCVWLSGSWGCSADACLGIFGYLKSPLSKWIGTTSSLKRRVKLRLSIAYSVLVIADHKCPSVYIWFSFLFTVVLKKWVGRVAARRTNPRILKTSYVEMKQHFQSLSGFQHEFCWDSSYKQHGAFSPFVCPRFLWSLRKSRRRRTAPLVPWTAHCGGRGHRKTGLFSELLMVQTCSAAGVLCQWWSSVQTSGHVRGRHPSWDGEGSCIWEHGAHCTILALGISPQ